MQSKSFRALYNRSKPINGWFNKPAAGLIYLIDEVQKDLGVGGDIFEIGVHHGRSSVFLAGLLQDNERLRICDIFNNQEKNASGSGKGDRAVFEENLLKYIPKSTLEIKQKLSTELTAEDFCQSPLRIFHVDGGHDYEVALFDLTLAHKYLVDGGVIILDDPFRMEWPGVTHAAITFLETNEQMTSFAVGFNKLLICAKEYVSTYEAAITNRDKTLEFDMGYPIAIKQGNFCGENLIIFYYPQYRFKGIVSDIGSFINKKFPSLRLATKRFLLAKQS